MLALSLGVALLATFCKLPRTESVRVMSSGFLLFNFPISLALAYFAAEKSIQKISGCQEQ